MSAQFSLGHLRRVAAESDRTRTDIRYFLETTKDESDDVWVDVDVQSVRLLADAPSLQSVILKAKIDTMKEIIGDCRCHEGFKIRSMKDPECLFHDWEIELQELQNKLEAAEA